MVFCMNESFFGFTYWFKIVLLLQILGLKEPENFLFFSLWRFFIKSTCVFILLHLITCIFKHSKRFYFRDTRLHKFDIFHKSRLDLDLTAEILNRAVRICENHFNIQEKKTKCPRQVLRKSAN